MRLVRAGAAGGRPVVWLGFYKNQISFLKESDSVLILRARRSKERAFQFCGVPTHGLEKAKNRAMQPAGVGFVLIPAGNT